MADVASLEIARQKIIEEFGEEALVKFEKTMKEMRVSTPKESATITEVFDKYNSFTGYRLTVKTVKKGTMTQIFKMGGRISKQDAFAMAENEKARLIRKYKIA